MHPRYVNLHQILVDRLNLYQINPLPGLISANATSTLAMQFVESERKKDRIVHLASRMPSADRLKPGLESFDPEFAAIERKLAGDLDEACWLTFLSVHFGRHREEDWLLCRQIYGAMGFAPYWTWQKITSDLADFRPWLQALIPTLNTPLGGFGNHRKYESIGNDRIGLASVVESYVNWVQSRGGHKAMLNQAIQMSNGDPKRAFKVLYRDMSAVLRFGRLGKFDFLTMISKLGIAAIEADSTYLSEATGPKRGAKLLFYGRTDAQSLSAVLENKVALLAAHLNLGMQTMEDALCNWQKSPLRFVAFRG